MRRAAAISLAILSLLLCSCAGITPVTRSRFTIVAAFRAPVIGNEWLFRSVGKAGRFTYEAHWTNRQAGSLSYIAFRSVKGLDSWSSGGDLYAPRARLLTFTNLVVDQVSITLPAPDDLASPPVTKLRQEEVSNCNWRPWQSRRRRRS